MESEKYPEMDKMEMPDANITWVDIDLATNGWIISWNERENKKSDSMDHCESSSKKKVFGLEEEDKAFHYFKMYKIAEMKGNSSHEGKISSGTY